MKRDKPGKTRQFVKKGLILWVVVIVIYMLLKMTIANFGDLEVENSRMGLFDQLSDVVLIYGIGGIPLILFLSIVLKLAEKAIDGIGSNKN